MGASDKKNEKRFRSGVPSFRVAESARSEGVFHLHCSSLRYTRDLTFFFFCCCPPQGKLNVYCCVTKPRKQHDAVTARLTLNVVSLVLYKVILYFREFEIMRSIRIQSRFHAPSMAFSF